ncbi:MAG: FAD-dependent monooxygenase [bacterium]|nr:FAD-dependent monooxygenase [bacterium]
MSAAREYQAVIVGGGPAGLAAGIVLARSGISTLLLERRTLPYAKVCGEGLMPVGLRALESLGVDLSQSPNEVGLPFRGIRYRDCGTGRAAEADFAEGPGRGVPRRILAARLLAAAKQHELLEIRDGVLCEALRRTADGAWEIRAGESVFRASLLIGADGIHSFARRAARLDRDSARNDPRRWGARWHFPIAPWTDGFVEVRLLAQTPGVECYITPVGEHETGVAFLWDRQSFRPAGGDTLLASLLAIFPEVAARVRDLTPLSDGGAIGPLLHRTRAVSGSGVALIGDAAGYLDAATGEGLSLAFEAALALENTVVPALGAAARSNASNVASGANESEAASSAAAAIGAMATDARACRRRELDRALRAYSREHRRITANYYLTTRLVLWLGRRPRWMRRVIAGLGASPAFFQRVLSVNMGTRGVFAVSPGALLRFLKGLRAH